MVVPSYVAARCDQVLRGSSDDPERFVKVVEIAVEGSRVVIEEPCRTKSTESGAASGLMITLIHSWAFNAVGLTQASNVIPTLRSSDAESFTVTDELVPLKDNAPPNFPVFVQPPTLTVPLFPFPEVSRAMVPVPSSKPYTATGPVETLAVVIAMAVAAVWFVPSETVNWAEYVPAVAYV